MAVATSCASKECYENQTTLPLASFYEAGTMQPVMMDVYKIYGLDAPADSLLSDSAALQHIYLPFRQNSDTTAFVFRYDGFNVAAADTLTFVYESKPWFVSEQCGVVNYYHIRSICHTDYKIDSVAVPGLIITNANKTNIEIFLRPQTEKQ